MATLGIFARRMKQRAAKVEARTTEIKKQVARAVLTNVVTATPIRTGRARYNWNVGLGAPNHDTDIESFSSFGRTGDWLGKMATSRVAILRATQKDAVYISNALPYIQQLNQGYSPQAPVDYVRIAAISGALVVRNARVLR
jgi:hypothetical protein